MAESSDSDCDFLGVVPSTPTALVPATDVPADVVPVPAPVPAPAVAAPLLVAGAEHDLQVAVVDALEASRLPKWRQALTGTRPRDRDDMQKLVAGFAMRVGKLSKHIETTKAKQTDRESQLVDLVQGNLIRHTAALRVKGGQLVLNMLDGASGRSCRLTSRAWLRIAYDYQNTSDNIVAQIFKVDKHVVRRTKQVMSHIHFQEQMDTLKSLESTARAMCLAFCILSVKFDCQTRKLVATIAPTALSVCHRSSRFELLVSLSHMRLGWGNLRGDNPGLNDEQHLSIIRPVVPLTTTSAASLDYGMFKAPMISDIWDSCCATLSVAQLGVLHFGRDNAASNKKMKENRFQDLAEEYPNFLGSDKACSLHGNDLVKGAAVAMRPKVIVCLNIL